MLAEYHASPDARELSIPLETNTTKFETSHFSVGQENLQNNEHEFRNLQTMLDHISNIMYSENRKGMLRYRKTEFEHTVQSKDINVLQDYLHSVYINNPGFLYKDKRSTSLFCLIVYHVLVMSENENSTQILNVIKVKLLELRESDVYFLLYSIYQLYLDVYYKDNPNEIFTNIHTIWKSDKATELNLKLAYCKHLFDAKDYKTLIQLLHQHADYLIEGFEENEHQLCINSSTAAMVLLHILHHQVSINKMEKVKTIQTIRKSKSYRHNKTLLFHGFIDFLRTLDNKQLLCTPYVIKLLHSLMKEQPLDYLRIILVCSNRLSQANHYTERIKFIKCHFKLISSFPTNMLKTQGCYYTQQYCISLLLLLNEFISCHDTHNINLVLTKLLELRISFLSDVSGYTCYCFMGKQECSTERKENVHDSIYHGVPILVTEFKKELLHYYKRRLHSMKRRKYSSFRKKGIWSSHTGSVYELCDFDLVMDDIMQGKLELAPYLQSIIDIMSKNIYKNESVDFLIGFIKRFADHNEASLYTIVKMLCALDLQPEVQDVVLQGLNAYLMISCNRQYVILSKFILDISMICPKGQFLHKLTSGIATLSLKFNDDTVNDFRKIIYKCYCTVRHDSKNDKDTNITKYKDHYSFIASMESEDEMKKLTNLTNFLLMLTLLLIASGGHHKSAELKKYLSLKYEYRDSILYLLWCSGDVEINPGPTLRKLRKVPKSQKERNWIYEMCSILLRLLKFKSIDLKNNGLWGDKPSLWPNEWPFYDPHNKPKDEEYSIKTDRKLLKNIEQLCHKKGIFEDINKFDDDTKSKVKEYKTEITAWTNNKTKLFEVYTLRQELYRLKEAKGNLQKYRNDPEVLQFLENLNASLTFDPKEDKYVSSESYTDIVRDLAITFCRIGKGLNPLQKSDNLWQMPPSGWCRPKKDFFSPCNAGQRWDKCTDKELVHNLLTCCKTKIKEYCTAKPVLIKLLHAWMHENEQEVRKYHTIWSNMEVINHSLKYLKLEGLLSKSQTHLEKLGIKPRTTDSKESIPASIDLCPVQGKQTNPNGLSIIQSDQENHIDSPGKLRDSDVSQQVVPLTLMGSEYQETDHATQNKTNKRKHQSTDGNYTEPKKLHKSDKGKSSPVDSSSCKLADNVNKKVETTLGQCVNQIIIPFEEQDYSSVVGDSSIPNTSSTTDQQSDLSNELPVCVELYINRIQNRSNATLEKDIEQFINLKEQDIDSS